VEHANRRPDAFFDAETSPRVYMPTDGIFEPGRAQLRTRGGLELSRLANLLALHPERPVVLEVHTDSNGRPEQQQALSQERADAVLEWLTDRGHLAPAQLRVEGHGGSRPLVPPDGSHAAQEPNRRIEVRLVQPGSAGSEAVPVE
jgi:outer membrane protein OmpA-like peptidoglycan-associated protein